MSEDPKLITRVINFELVQTICPRYLNVTDRQTDGRTTCDSNTALALRAWRGKNSSNLTKVVCRPRDGVKITGDKVCVCDIV